MPVVRDIHRIGGGRVDNLRLKAAERLLAPPGISVLKSDSPFAAADQMRRAFPAAIALHELTRTVGSTSPDLIRAAGFDLQPDPTRKFPNHFRIIHANGAMGFDALDALASAFTDTAGT